MIAIEAEINSEKQIEAKEELEELTLFTTACFKYLFCFYLLCAQTIL